VTDAALALGWIPDRTFRSAGLRLQRDLARAAIETEVARPMNLSTADAARAILRIATSKMGDLVRKATIERGVDPRGATLVSYGGAGGQYAAAVCEEVGIKTFVVPLLASALSAFGMIFADEVMFAEQSLHRRLPIEPKWLIERLSEIEERLVSELTAEGSDHVGVSAEWFVDMRFAQQINELRVQISLEEIQAGQLDDVFSARYETRYGKGTAYAPAGVELIGLAVRVRRATHRSSETNIRMATSASFDLDPVEVTFLDGRTMDAQMHSLARMLVEGGEVVGPAIIVGPGTAVVVPENAVAHPLGTEAIEVSLRDVESAS
jgi:N-methylhydantoinase A